MKLHNLTRSAGLKDKANRIGRGNGSKGNYSGKGLKWQKARSGGGVQPWFEGGQTPLVQRLPKQRGFKRYYKFVDNYNVVNIADLQEDTRIKDGEITKATLVECGYIKKETALVKVLWNGELSKKLNFVGMETFSKSAKDKIEKAGGSTGEVQEKETKPKKEEEKIEETKED